MNEEERREAAFLKHVERSANYFAAVRSADDQPWYVPGHPKRERWIERLQLARDISEIDLRRAVFMERYK